ncbi:MAG: FAD-binding oxidoreductase [Deltaproteobacteria bacterium]|nr:FAD-binding oxidoreductase [Deltaproteobacteria bacterium]MCZ6621627.1 FAD-dependent oxidoreductase [Deltaproteobacteria bacterium]
MTSAHTVIVGAGFAGAATAYHLARSGASGIVVLEQERLAGVHSSGRNASMIRQIVPDPSIGSLAQEGAAFVRNLPSDWPLLVNFEQNGSLLLASGKEWESLTRDAERARQIGIEVECWSRQRAEQYVKILKGADFDGAVWCPTDGVIDIHALLSGYLKSATSMGTEVRYGGSVRAIDVEDNRVTGVMIGNERVKADVIINAAGAWAGLIGEMAGSVKVPLLPSRRHLFLTPPLPWVDSRWPFVWDVSHELYFRPESGGLLLCPCDQDEMAPGIPPTDDSMIELLAGKVSRHLPEISSIPIKRSWAGLRTLCADGRFVIGWDPKIHGFFWLAGLGGHGVTTSSAVGALATRLILSGNEKSAGDISPKRFMEV